VKLSVFGTGSDSTRKTHQPTAARAQMCQSQVVPTHARMVTSNADRAVMAVTIAGLLLKPLASLTFSVLSPEPRENGECTEHQAPAAKKGT
jgi:hypothetical protein